METSDTGCPDGWPPKLDTSNFQVPYQWSIMFWLANFPVVRYWVRRGAIPMHGTRILSTDIQSVPHEPPDLTLFRSFLDIKAK
ncbi:hypothetical protein N7461_004252 [Penicillium sp. DV-2018c]|nr:hypothetical protein N7461_004252 [Penicillium sp. DV-2018c]